MNRRGGAGAFDASFDVDAYFISDRGCLREQNEDSLFYRRPEDALLLIQYGVLALVADGMGGHQGGQVAARMATDIVARDYYASRKSDPRARLYRALRAANQAIHTTSRAVPACRDMGTTCTALAVVGRSAYCAHVGDSRLYLVRRGAAYRMTEDHSWIMGLVKNGDMSGKEARNHPHRNLLLRALGLREKVEVDTWSRPLPVHDGDVFVLCSDGLHDLVGDEEITLAAGAHPPPAVCKQLIALAKERGGHDNISVGVLRLGGGMITKAPPLQNTRDSVRMPSTSPFPNDESRSSRVPSVPMRGSGSEAVSQSSAVGDGRR